MLTKNTASQKVRVFAFDSTTGLPKTGDAANISAYISKDFGAVTQLTDTSATEEDATNAKGYYLFDISQTETNADDISVSAKSSTSNIVVVGAPARIRTVAPNSAALSIDSNGRVDVIKVNGAGQTARDLGAQLDATVSSRMATYTQPTGFLAATFPTTVASTTNITAGTIATVSGNVNGNVGGNVSGTIGGLSTQAKADVNAEADTALADAGVTTTRTGYLDKLNITGNVAASSEVTAIQNNTRVVRVVPESIERPDSGTQTYRVELLLYDETGNMEAPDSAPTVALVNQSGTDRSSRLDSTTMALVSTGRYRCAYTADPADTLEQLVWTFSVVEGGATRLYGNSSLIVDTTAADFTSADRTKLNTLAADYTTARAAKLDNLDAAVTTRAPASTALSSSVWTGTHAGYILNLSAGVVPTAAQNAAAASAQVWADIPFAVDGGGNVLASVVFMAGNVLDAAALDASAVAEIQSGLATPTNITAAAGVTLTSAYDFAKGTVAMPESYAANGAAPTPEQCLYAVHQMLMQFAISGVSYTVRKLDNATTAFVVTLDDADNPTSAVRV